MEEEKFLKVGLKEKIILLVLQVMLPFVMYIAIDREIQPLGITAAILLTVSMLVLVVFG